MVRRRVCLLPFVSRVIGMDEVGDGWVFAREGRECGPSPDCIWAVFVRGGLGACTLGGGFAEVKEVPRREMCCGGYAVDSGFGRLAAKGGC